MTAVIRHASNARCISAVWRLINFVIENFTYLHSQFFLKSPVCRQNGFVTINNCTVESVLVSAVIGQINIQDSKINTATLERNIGSDMTLPANTAIDPVTIKNSTINFASATMPDGYIYVQDSNITTFKINGKTYNSVQNVTFKVSEGIVQIAQ